MTLRLSLFGFAAAIGLSFFVHSVSADVVNLIADVPTTNIIQQSSGVEGPQGTASGQQAFAFRPTEDPSNRARGQSFLFSDGAASGLTYDISAITASLNSSNGQGAFTGTRPDGTLNFTVFQWDTNDPDSFTNWDAGSGGLAAGQTQILSQSLAIPGNFFANTTNTNGNSNADLLEIAFNPGTLQLTEGTAYGILYHYEISDSTGLTEDITISFDTRQDANFAGGLLNTGTAATFAAADNGQSDSRDLNLFISGTAAAVPEPSSLAVLGLGFLGLVARRRRS